MTTQYQYEQFSSYISTIYHNVQRIERDEMVKYGLTGAYAQCLVTLARFPNGITCTTLCEVTEKDKAAVSRIVANMEHKGLIVRKGLTDTAYRARLILTEEGKRAARYVNERAKLAVLQAGAGLSDEELDTFYKTLNHISTNLREICKNGLPEYEPDSEVID